MRSDGGIRWWGGIRGKLEAKRRGWTAQRVEKEEDSVEDELKMDEVGAECSRGEMGPSVDAEDEIGFS